MLADIKKEYSEVKTDRKQIKNFGILFCAVLCLLSIWFMFRGKSWALSLIPCGLFFLFFGVFFYKFLVPFYKMWMLFGIIMGWIVSRVILIVLFYLVFTPINLLLKIMRKDILDQNISKEKTSYWNTFDEDQDAKHYDHQF